MLDPYPLLYADGGGTRWVVVEPGGLTDRHWYGPGSADFYDRYTGPGLAWLNPGGERTVGSATPIGSRFD